jgi:hypothetical protein
MPLASKALTPGAKVSGEDPGQIAPDLTVKVSKANWPSPITVRALLGSIKNLIFPGVPS